MMMRTFLTLPVTFPALVAAVVVGTFAGTPIARADTCPNAAHRIGASANLPDCRAYEMVSPVDKAGNDATYVVLPVIASGDGKRLIYGSDGAFAGGPSAYSDQYFATRSSAGWLTRPLSLPNGIGFNISAAGSANTFADFRCDLCDTAIVQTFESADPGDDDPSPFFPGFTDIYDSDGVGGFSWLSRGSIGGTEPADARYAGRSADGRHVAFDVAEALEPAVETPVAGRVAYERIDGQTKVVGVDDAGAMLPGGSVIGGPPYSVKNAISNDGSRIFFQSPDGPGAHLYLRENATRTVEVSATALLDSLM